MLVAGISHQNGVGWGGDDDVPCTCTHLRCHAKKMNRVEAMACEMIRHVSNLAMTGKKNIIVFDFGKKT